MPSDRQPRKPENISGGVARNKDGEQAGVPANEGHHRSKNQNELKLRAKQPDRDEQRIIQHLVIQAPEIFVAAYNRNGEPGIGDAVSKEKQVLNRREDTRVGGGNAGEQDAYDINGD